MKSIVYIIDDNIMSEFATRMILDQSVKSFEVVAFDNAEEGLAALQRTAETGEGVPDYILLDLKMPEVDGWGFLDKLSEIGIQSDKTDIYMVSAYAGTNTRKRAGEHSLLKGYLERPISQHNIEQMFSAK